MHEKQHDERSKWHRNHLIEQVTFFNHDGKKLSCRKVMENRVDNMLKLVKIIQKWLSLVWESENREKRGSICTKDLNIKHSKYFPTCCYIHVNVR